MTRTKKRAIREQRLDVNHKNLLGSEERLSVRRRDGPERALCSVHRRRCRRSLRRLAGILCVPRCGRHSRIPISQASF
jgi:hypothetical protein